MIMKLTLMYSTLNQLIGSFQININQISFFDLLSQEMIHQSSLLFKYGIIIGYIIFIIFIYVLQLRNYYQLIYYKPIFGKFFLSSFSLVALGFSIGVFLEYQFQKTILLVLSFLLITALFDMIRDKIMLIVQGNIVHPKKIL